MAAGDDVTGRDARVEARRMREYRAHLLEQVAAGAIGLDGLLEQRRQIPPAATVKVVVLAEKVPGVGKVRARRAMERLGIAEDARLGEVNDDTLAALWAAMAVAATRPVRHRD
jgi:hypothetical protein